MVFTEFERRGYANEQARLAIDQMGKLELPGQDRWLSKVGGWPAPIQEPITVPLAFQLGGDDKSGLIWGDAGCAYFWRTQISGNELRRKLGSYMDAPPPSEWQIQVDH
jgi:hypothetical protein